MLLLYMQEELGYPAFVIVYYVYSRLNESAKTMPAHDLAWSAINTECLKFAANHFKEFGEL
jgi:hypothetical protein